MRARRARGRTPHPPPAIAVSEIARRTPAWLGARGPLTTATPARQTLGMPRLIRIDTGDAIGEISDNQLKFLVEQLEEEHDEDQDYFVDRDTLELLSDNGADPELLALLEKAIGDDDSMDIAWE
jgi:hypothetical protein